VKIKLDENMPRRAEVLLRERGHDVDTVHEEGQAGRPDADVARASTGAGRMLMTLDRGFPSPATLPPNHPGVVVFKVRDQSAAAVTVVLIRLLDKHDLEELRGCIVIAGRDRVRIRRPT
jgi:predicted nuclease of predicted toxin-antitoxin system